MADRSCGPIGFHLTNLSLEDGTLCRGFSPLPGGTGYHLLKGGFQLRFKYAGMTFQEFLQRLEDETEFKILTAKVHVLNAAGNSFRDLEDYLAHRERFFGPIWEYVDSSAESDKELAESTHSYRKGKTVTLRSRLDSQFQSKSMDQAVKYFYRWIRKAYKKEFGDDVDVPAFIFRGRSDILDEALKGVNFKDAHYGGFNPRPIKGKNKQITGYKLGTLSDHASGMAIDIEPDDNPQISVKTWEFIEKFCGKSSTPGWREAQWISSPGTLWQYIQDLSDLFAETYTKKVKALIEVEQKQEEEKKKQAANAETPLAVPTAKTQGSGAEPKSDPERFKRKVLGDHYEELKKCTDGFFTLERDLVESLREHGLTWGAVFGRHSPVDLMHFELHKTPLPPWPPPKTK